MNHLWSRAAFSAGNTRSITIQTNLERHITEVFLFNNDMWKILFQPSFQVRQSLGIQMSVINDDILTGFQSLRHTLKTEFTNLILKFRCPCGMVKSSTIQFLSDVIVVDAVYLFSFIECVGHIFLCPCCLTTTWQSNSQNGHLVGPFVFHSANLSLN